MAAGRLKRIGYIGWRGMQGCEVLEIDPHLTALIGPAGTGKSTLLMCLAYALLPDRRTLDIRPISQLEDTHEAGKDTLVGRLADDYEYAYIILDIETRESRRLLAGVHVEPVEGRTRVAFTPWLFHNPPAEASIAELFALKDGSIITYPDFPELKRHLASDGYDLTACRTVGEYGQALYEVGLLPGPLVNQEERSQYAQLIEATFQGGLSSAITKRLKEYLLPAQSQVSELVEGIRDCANEVFKTRRAVADATRDLARLQSTYGVGREAVVAAIQSIEHELHTARGSLETVTAQLTTHYARAEFLRTTIPSLHAEIEATEQTKTSEHQAALTKLEIAQTELKELARRVTERAQHLTALVERLTAFQKGQALWAELSAGRGHDAYEALLSSVHGETQALMGQQAKVGLEIEALRREHADLKQGRSSAQAQRLASELAGQPLTDRLARLTIDEVRAIELRLGTVTDGIVGAELQQLAALSPSSELPAVFWLGQNDPSVPETQRVGAWEATSVAGGFLVHSAARTPLSSPFARKERRKAIEEALDRHALLQDQLAGQVKAVQRLHTRLIQNHDLLNGYLANRLGIEALQREIDHVHTEHASTVNQQQSQDELVRELQSNLRTLQKPYDDHLTKLRKLVNSHEREQLTLDHNIEQDERQQTATQQVLEHTITQQQAAQACLGHSYASLLALSPTASSRARSTQSLVGQQYVRLQDLRTALGEELVERYDSLRVVNAEDRLSIVRMWPDLMKIIRDTVNMDIADTEGHNLIQSMQQQRAALDVTLKQQEEEVRINARNIHLNINAAIRSQRSRIDKLSKFGTRLEFGNVTGIRVTLIPRRALLDILDQFADQLSLFSAEKPIDLVLQEFFTAVQPEGLKASSEQLLDYRFYVDLVIEARRQEGDWAPATALSGTESIGCGLAIALMLVRSITERQEGHGGKVKASHLCPVFTVDEASRTDPSAQRMLVEFARRERFQLVVTAPELAPTFPCTLYALKREFIPNERLIIRGIRVKDTGGV